MDNWPLLLGAATLVAWSVLTAGRGGFWRGDQRLTPAAAPASAPSVAVVIPARDEAASIAAVVRAHLQAVYPSPAFLVLVDDASGDGTAQAALQAAAELGAADRIEVIQGAPLPRGWTGKLWAQQQGVEAALARAPEYLLLCDADIAFGATTLSSLVAKAERDGLALVSLMARLDARGFWGGLLVPAFVFFFQKLYPFPRVNDPRARAAGAAGGVMLVRAEAVRRLDLPRSIRAALIDDCALAARVKAGPPKGSIWLGLATGDQAVSLRDNRPLSSIWRMVARTAYAQLGRQPLAVIGAALGMGLLYLAPPGLALFALGSPAGWLGAIAWSLMAICYAPTALDYGKAWSIPLLPLAGLLYAAMTVDSAIQHHLGKGGLWKGRTYADLDA